nr:MAG TPA: Large polyvalent protein associated domain 38 [Caudoviricetes sp.]
MARMQGFGRKREEEEEQKRVQQQAAADNSQNSAVIRGREHAKETAGALKQTGHKVVAEQKVNPFEQTAGKTNAQLLADYDAEMAGREGMAMGMTPRRDLGTQDVEVDFSTIKDNKQAAYFAGTLANEDVAEEFLKDWAAYSAQDSDEVLYSAEGLLGDKLFATPRSERGKSAAKANAAMQTLASGLVMDADGNDMDLSSASLPMVIQSIRADPDSSSRKAKVKALYELTQMPDNPYSGMTFDENEANTFLYSADWDDKDYTDAVDEYQSAFYAGSGHDEDNLKKYLELVASINEGDEVTGDAYSKRQSRSMRAALDKAWTSATGLPAPTDEDIAAWNELDQTAQAEGKKASPLFTWLFGDKERKAEKESTRESAQPKQASTLDQIASADGVKRAALTASTAPGIALPQEGSKSGGRWFDAAQKQAEEKTEAAQTEAAQAPTAQKEDKRWFDQIYEQETPTPIAQRESVSTPGEAVMLYLRGEPLTQEEHEWVDGILSSNGGKLLLNQKMHKGSDGTLTYGMDYRAKPLYVPGEIPSDVGSWIQQDLDILKSGQLDDATAGAGYLALMQIINDANAWIESGEVSIPAGKNPYSVYLSTHDSAKAVSQSISEAQIIAIEQQKSAAQAQKQAKEAEYESLVNAVTSGTATPEQIEQYCESNLIISTPTTFGDEGYFTFGSNLDRILDTDDGEYWNGTSAAAVEGLNSDARTAFRKTLADESKGLLYEYGKVAVSLGMTTQEYLEKCGITSPYQIADMAYSRMVRRGSAFLSSETAQAGLSSPEDDAATIGVVPAAGAGAAYGVLSTADSLASAPYNMLDALAYKANVDEIRSSYNGQYGINGRAIYREQLIQYANSGELSEEQSAALLQNIGQVSDIYDIGYKIDNGFIGNGYRAFMGAMDNAQKGLTDFAALGNEFEQNVFSGAASVSGSATGMLAVGALGAAGAPAMAASAAIYGTQAWNDSYEDALGNGLSKPTAAAIAMGPAVISTVVNAPGAKAEGNLLGGRSLLEQELAKQDALKALTLRGKFAMYAKSLAAEIPKNALSEGLEELEEDAATNLYNAMLYPVALKMDAGEKPQFSDILAGLASVDPTEMMTSGGKSFVGGAAASVVFTLAGYTGMAIRRKLPGYHLPAVTLSQEMMDGTADVTPENLAKVTESLADALQNPEVAQAVNETAQQAQDAQNTAAAAMAGVGAEHFEEGNTQVRMQQEAQTAADAAQQAADTAKSEFEAYSDAVMAGDIDKIKDMQQARVRLGENQKTANEYADTARKHKAAAEDAYAKGMDEARKRGAQISKEQNAQTVAQWQAEMETMSQIADIDAEMDAMRQSYADAETMGLDEDVKQAIESRIDELRRERVEIAEPGIEEATATRERLEQGLAQAQELGLDEDTRAEMERQVELARAKERIYTQSRSDWALEEELYPGETGDSKATYANSAKPDMRYANPDAEVQLTGEAEQALPGIAPEESRAASDGRPGETVVSTTFEEQYAPELKTMDTIIKAGRQAEALTQALKNGDPVSAKQIAEIQNSLNESLSKLDDNALNVFASELSDTFSKIGKLEIETDAAQERDTARQEADYERYLKQTAQKQLAAEHYNALSGVAKTLRGTDVFINESQAADILSMTGMKTIPQVNFAYGTRFTQNRASGAIPLNGQFYVRLAQESGGYMDAASLNPHEDIMRALMDRKQSYREMRQKVEEPKDRAQIRRAAKAVMEGDVGKSAEGEQKRTYRGVEVEQAEGKSKPTGSNYGENIYSATKRFAKALGIGIKLGDSRVPDGASGYYQSRVGYAGVDARSASRVDVVIHEIGHALSEKLGLSGTPEMVAALKAENASWAQNYTDAEMAGEAMAEYVWRRVLSDEQGRRFAGDAFTDTFDYQMRQSGYDKAFDLYKNDIRKWLNQSTQDRLQSMVVDRANAKEKETLKEKLLRLTYAFVDSSAPAELINEKIRAETGESTVAFSENLRDAVLLRNKADERALYIIGDGLVARDGSTIIGGSFADAIKEGGLKGKDYKDFELYWLVKDSIDRDKQNKPVFDDGFASTAERRAFIAEKDKTHPEYAKTVDSLLKTWNAFTHEYLVSSGRLDEAGWKYFQSIYPYYAPTYRIKDGDFSIEKAKKAGFSVRQAKGSTELILNPMDSMLEMVGRIVRQDMTNQAAQKLEMLLDTHEGLGEIAHKIETDTKPDKTAQFDPLNGEFGDLIHANVDESGADGQNVITVWHDDGTTSKIEILNEPFFRMMANMPDGGKQVTDFIGRGTRAMTFLTTGANSVFGLRNFARDFQNGVNYGTWAKSYLDGAAKWLMTAYRIKSGDEAVKGYDALGGNDGRIDTTKKGIKDLRHTLYTTERLFHTRDGKWTPLNMEYFKNYDTSTLAGTAKWAGKKLWEYATLQSANEFIEKTTRVAEYLYGKHDLTTAEGRAEAYRASQESTVDFGRKGASSFGRGIRNVVPFMNASLQGVYRTGRQFTAQERGKVVSRVMRSVVNTGLFTAVCAGLRAKFLDDKDKEQFAFLSDDLKNGHFFIPNFAPSVFGDAPLIRIPIDQNPLDYFTHAMVFNALESGKGDEFTIDMATTFATMVDNLNPVGSTIFDPIIATQTNKNWYGSRIVPSYMESWDATTQYTEDTPDAFIGLSRFIKSFTGAEISPMMLQYMAQQYTGFAGQVAIPTLGGDNPVTAFTAYAQKMLTSDPLKSNDVVSEVYNANTFLTTVVKAGDNGRELNMLRGDLTPRQAQKAYDVAYDMTHSGGTIYEAKKTISEGYETIKAINARTDLTDEEKYEKSSRIRAKMCELALEVNQEFAKYQEKFVTGESLLTGMLKTLNGGTTIKKQK